MKCPCGDGIFGDGLIDGVPHCVNCVFLKELEVMPDGDEDDEPLCDICNFGAPHTTLRCPVCSRVIGEACEVCWHDDRFTPCAICQEEEAVVAATVDWQWQQEGF
jgi:hypothetical protein